MKKMIGMFLIIFNCFAGDVDIAHDYQKALDVHQIDKNKVRAKAMLEDLLQASDQRHPLFKEIYKTYLEVSDLKDRQPLEKAIKFVTGRKEETYCKNVGLVYAKFFHNDETESQLFLTENKRKMEEGSYSVAIGGSWKYQLDTEYRDPIVSDVWINSANANHYEIQEARKNGDKGKWSRQFRSGSKYGSSNTSGQVKEPIPMYMAVDFHAWGTPDLGYSIDFKLDATDDMTAGENTFRHGRLFMSSKRVVKKKMNSFEIKDLNNDLHQYSDCYQVNTKIQFAEIKPRENLKKK